MIRYCLLIAGALSIFIHCQRNPYTQGQVLFQTFCLNCHMEDGSGMGVLYPSLQDSDYLGSRSGELACLIKNGKKSSQLVTLEMPAHKEMTEASMTNLINYINYKWGNQKITTMAIVSNHLSNCSEE